MKKKPRKRKKLRPLNLLMKDAVKVFNAWVRNRDMKRLGGVCYTCPGLGNQAGHWRHNNNATKFNEILVNLQGPKCNLYMSGNLAAYTLRLVKEHGQEKIDELYRLSHTTKQFKRKDLEAIIEKYRIS